MPWSKRSRIQLVVAAVIGVTSVVCIAAAVGTWKATSNKHNVTANSSSLKVPSIAPTQAPSPVVGMPSPLPSYSPSRAPTHHPTSQPVPSPTTAPTRPPTRVPTMSPSVSPTKTYARMDLDVPSAGPSEYPPDSKVTTFYVIADAPYTQVEANMLPKQVKALPSDAEFLVHLGDIRSARDGGACRLYEYTDVATTLRQSKVPVFIILGGKEYTYVIRCSFLECDSPADSR